MEHQEQDGTLKPPSSQEQTDLPVAELSKKPLEMVRLTMDEADVHRALNTFKHSNILPLHIETTLNNRAYDFSMWIIENFQEGRERSQALGQINAVVVWAKWAGQKNKS